MKNAKRNIFKDMVNPLTYAYLILSPVHLHTIKTDKCSAFKLGAQIPLLNTAIAVILTNKPVKNLTVSLRVLGIGCQIKLNTNPAFHIHLWGMTWQLKISPYLRSAYLLPAHKNKQLDTQTVRHYWLRQINYNQHKNHLVNYTTVLGMAIHLCKLITSALRSTAKAAHSAYSAWMGQTAACYAFEPMGSSLLLDCHVGKASPKKQAQEDNTHPPARTVIL